MRTVNITRRLFCIALAVLLLLPATIFSYNTKTITPNAPCDVPNRAPVIDGVISMSEGWSDAVIMDEEHCGNFKTNLYMTSSAEVRFAYSQDGIFFSASITENENFILDGVDYSGNGVVLSTGIDNIDVDAGGNHPYGFNGDVFCVSFDPLNAFLADGYRNPATDCAPRYCVGLFADGARMYHSYCQEGDITSRVTVSGRQTDNGWCFEAMLPWNILIEDSSYNSLFNVNLILDKLTATGANFTAACIYQDRFVEGSTDTWGTFVTAPTYTIDGIPSMNTFGGIGVPLHGLSLYMGGEVLPFTDVSNNAWYYRAVKYCYKNGSMNGISDSLFGVSTKMTRAMLVTVISKIEGVKASDYAGSTEFSDVPAGQWYSPYVKWASSKSLVNGYGDTFGPNDFLTREQMAVVMYKYHGMKNPNFTWLTDSNVLNSYNDASSISAWAYTPVLWSVTSGLMTGSNNCLYPSSNITRAEVSQMIYKYLS